MNLIQIFVSLTYYDDNDDDPTMQLSTNNNNKIATFVTNKN